MAKESFFANKGEVKHALHSNEFIYLLIAKEFSGGEEEEFHQKLKALLKEFLDVFFWKNYLWSYYQFGELSTKLILYLI